MTLDLTSKAFLKQREFERRLAALAFIDQDYVLQSCGWLEPQILSDNSIRKFWTSLRTGKTNIEAAEDAGIFNDLMEWIIENSFVSHAIEYAYNCKVDRSGNVNTC